MDTKSHKDLIVWQRAMDVVDGIYDLTQTFPHNELYGLTSQMRRSAVSIPSNVVEGRCRGSRKEYTQFLLIAYGSGAELETQYEIAKRQKFIDKQNILKVERQLEEVMKMLNVMITKLKK